MGNRSGNRRIKVNIQLPDGRECYALILKKHYDRLAHYAAETKPTFWQRVMLAFGYEKVSDLGNLNLSFEEK